MDASDLISDIRRGTNTAVVTSSETALFYLLNSDPSLLRWPLFVLTKNDSEARRLSEELNTFFGDRAYWYPKKQLTFHDIETESPDIRAYRMTAIDRLISGQNPIIVTTPEGFMTTLSPPEHFVVSEYQVGGTLNISDFSLQMAQNGYESVNIVEGKGQMSVRGGIVDIFPPNMESPVRFELFDDEIDSIRTFDVMSQRSLDKLEQVRILPACEFILPQGQEKQICNHIRQEFDAVTANFKNMPLEKLEKRVSDITEAISNGKHRSFLSNYHTFIYPKRSIIADYCSDCRILLIEADSLLADYELFVQGCEQRFADMLEHGEVLPSNIHIFADLEELLASIQRRPWISVKAFQSTDKYLQPQTTYELSSSLLPQYMGNLDSLLEDVLKWRASLLDVYLFAGNEKRALDLRKFFHSNGIAPVIISGLSQAKDAQVVQSSTEEMNFLSRRADSSAKPIFIVKNHLSTGCRCEGAVLVGDNEIFGSAKKPSAPTKHKKAISSFTELSIGSYVVHEIHGIAKFLGITTSEISGRKQDYLGLQYAGDDKIYVPVDRLDLIQPYISTDGEEPRLSRLSGKDWTRAKEKASASIKKLAFDLVQLYARREVYKGFRYSSDTVWQQELESSFMYEETEDQLRAIAEIKKDMEDYKIMDRLLCGDVGFGKTEVAVRAAFKAVMDGKQVAVLAPTTILAQQHFQTFTERYANFPVTVDVLSRFRTPSQQKKTLEKLEKGEVDVLIGTHRLLSNDVKFKDLGLLIVDEEQRFGVNHKEKIKNLKKNIDVLTLSATPIPRTLHMSLVGIRDISIIETPPRDRFPVQTYVIEDNDAIIREAVLRELDRDGQVFFLYNNVQRIDQFKVRLSNLIPEARIAVAHGQMSETQLEKVMMAYLNHEYDILLCSTIIESGIDIPNANTLFVYDADKLGLSQLYQIRGRIGRTNRVAYAYLMYRADKVLTEVAAKRLKAIKDFTELGSGFRIAMRDLEIRGAGNVLGSEQSGHMTNIGYDLYCKMLADEIASLQGKVSDDPIEVTIQVDYEAYIPSEYIPDENVRLEMYKKVSMISTRKEKYDIEEEIEDRYSTLPQQVYNLTNIAYLRALCQTAQISKVKQKGDSFEMSFLSNDVKLSDFGAIKPSRNVKVDVSMKQNVKLIIHMPNIRPANRLAELTEVCEDLFLPEQQASESESQ